MLSFSSICQELEADLQQQQTKLDIFSKNNFIWLEKIHQKVDPNYKKTEPKVETQVKSCMKKKSSASNNTVQIEFNTEENSKIQTEEFSKLDSGEGVDIDEGMPSNMSLQSTQKTAENIQQKTPPPRSSLRTSIPPRPHDFDSESPINSSFVDDPKRHVSFSVTNNPSEQGDSVSDSPIALKNIDVLSSDSEAQASPITLVRTNENAASNVTPQRSSLVRQAIHSSFDQMKINSQMQDAFGMQSDNISVSSESSACSYFPSDSGQMPSPLKETEQNNEKAVRRVYADTKDIRFSLDPTQLLLSSEEFTTPNTGTYSVSSNAFELAQQAKVMREKWAKMVAEKNQALNTENDKEKIEAETKEDNTVYQISDHGSEDSDEDLEVFESDPEEVHGKKVPNWAHGEGLKNGLLKQAKIDPDTIFPNFSNTCELEVVFGKINSKWQTRADSAWWDHDGLTPEEIQRFKKAAGYA